MTARDPDGGGATDEISQHGRVDERWERILRTSNDAFVGADELDRITDWNPAAEELFGWNADEVVGASLADTLIPPEFRERHHRGMERFLRDGTEQVMFRPLELPALHRDGRRIPIEIRIWPADVGGEWRFYAFLRDLRPEQSSRARMELLATVTEVANRSIRAEEAVRAALSEICVLTGWPVGHAYLADPDRPDLLLPSDWWHGEGYSAFVEATQQHRFESGTGLPGRVLAAGRPQWVDLAHDDNFPRAAAAAADGLHSGFAFPIKTGSAVVAVLEFYTRESVDADADLLHLVGQVGTQLGRVFERQRSMEELARIADIRSRMMRMLAHDVQTPLVAVRGFAQLLAEGIGETPAEDLQQLADGIVRNADRLDRMVATLLTGARAEAGQLISEPTEVVLRPVVEQVASDIGVDGLRLQIAEHIAVHVDEDQLFQILSNLLSNAKKYGAPPVDVTAAAENGMVSITISDHGPGLEPDLLDAAFTPFVRGRHGAGGRGGTGLGLWIARELARANGGDVRPGESDAGGACFEVLLPAA